MEVAHLNGEGRTGLLSKILIQNGLSNRTPSQRALNRRKRSAGVVGKQQVVGRPISRHGQAASPGPSHQPDVLERPLSPQIFPEGAPDLMDEAEPLTPEHGRPSTEGRRVSQRVLEQAAKHRWQYNRIPRMGDDDEDDGDGDNDDNDDTNGGEEQSGSEEMDMEGEDEDEESEEEDMNFASGQEGISILDSLDEDFLAEVSGLGSLTLSFFLTIF